VLEPPSERFASVASFNVHLSELGSRCGCLSVVCLPTVLAAATEGRPYSTRLLSLGVVKVAYADWLQRQASTHLIVLF